MRAYPATLTTRITVHRHFDNCRSGHRRRPGIDLSSRRSRTNPAEEYTCLAVDGHGRVDGRSRTTADIDRARAGAEHPSLGGRRPGRERLRADVQRQVRPVAWGQVDPLELHELADACWMFAGSCGRADVDLRDVRAGVSADVADAELTSMPPPCARVTCSWSSRTSCRTGRTDGNSGVTSCASYHR